MSRQKPIHYYQKQLEYAQKRAAYYARTDRPTKQTRDAQPRELIGYRPCFLRVGTANTVPLFAIQASKAAVDYFTLALLGLLDNTNAGLADAVGAPKGFKPSLIKLVEGDATPSVVPGGAKGSTRRVVKYSASSAGAAQSHYQAPISGGDTTPTLDEVKAKVRAIATAKATAIGTYGRVYLIPEKDILTFA